MGIPRTDETFQDGNLAFATGDSAIDVLIVGACSGGTQHQLYVWTDPEAPFNDCDQGDALELAAFVLEAVGGRVFFVKPVLTAETGPITITQPSGPPPVVASTGNPKTASEGIIEIVAGGAIGVSTFRYSIDGGDTWSPTYATVASFTGLVARLGMTFTFAAGTYVAGDRYTFTTKGPTYDATALGNAIDAVKSGPYSWRLIFPVGQVAGASDALKSSAAAALAAAIQTKLDALATSDKLFMRAIMEGPDVANDATGDAAIVTAFASTAAPRVVMGADFAEIRSPANGGIFKRSAAWAILARVLGARGGISEDAGEVGETFQGRLPSSVTSIRRNEAARQGLNDARIATLRTHRRAPSFYVTKAKTLAALGSDLELLQHAMIIDRGLEVASLEALKLLNKKQRVNATGTIYETDALVIERKITTALESALLNEGHVTEVVVKVDRTWNVLSSKRLKLSISLRPYGYPEIVSTTLGFAALVARAA